MAVKDYRTIRLPGRSAMRMPVIGVRKNNELSGISKATQEWTLEVGDIFGSHKIHDSEETLANHTELFSFSYDTVRETVGHSVNQMIANAATRFSDLVVIIQNATYSPVLEQYMNNGTMIPCVKIHRWGWINNSLVELECREFNVCYITQFKQILDYITLFIRPIERSECFSVYSQDGSKVGETASSTVNAETGTQSLE
ncbi:MAG: hypothetical protein LBJ89_00510 [Holosporales bacterium]|jgi:hypothetical protein|nr:hypothetical protein [Holosporales bacterium]